MTKVGQGPMLAKLEPEIPRGPGWTYEPKWDGFRTIVSVGDGITLESRGDRPINRFFPELVTLLEERNDGPFVADGEIVLVQPGSLSFDTLQLRLHPAESRVRKLSAELLATLILFDLLEEDGTDLTAMPLVERRERLAKLCAPCTSARRRRISTILTPGRTFSSRPGPRTSRRPRNGSRTRPGWVRTGSSRSAPTSPTCAARAGG